jgi:hypothetical protein
MTIKKFLEALERDTELLGLFRSNPAAACKEAGLNARQCRVVSSGDLTKIRNAIELESGPTKGLFIKVVM